MITGEFLTFACTSKSCAPPPVGTGGSNSSGGHEPVEVRGSSFDAIDKAFGIVGREGRKHDKWLKPIPDPSDGKYVYRVVSEADYQRMKRQGFLDTDGRGNIEKSEGLVTAADRVAWSYLGDIANKGAHDNPTGAGRALKIRRDAADGWKVDERDGYVKTNQRVPFKRVEMVSQPIKVSQEIEDDHGITIRHLHYQFGLEEFACTTKACAPPPIGTGGSVGGKFSTEGWDFEEGSPEHERHFEVYRNAWTESMGRLKDRLVSSQAAEDAEMHYIDRGFIGMNRVLRHGRGTIPPGTSDGFGNDLSATEETDASHLPGMAEAFRTAAVPLSSDLIVHRGIGESRSAESVMRAYAPGTVLKDAGYMSVTASPNQSREFNYYDRANRKTADTQVTLHIKAPKGTRVLAGFASEQELILDKGSSVRVEHVEHRKVRGFDQVHVYATVVG